MELTPFVEAVIPSLTLQLVFSLLGFTAAVVVVTLLNLGRRVPPVLAALVAAPTFVLAVVMGELYGSWIATSVSSEDAIWYARASFGGSMFTVFVVYLPSLLLAAGCAVAAVRRGPRAWWFVGIGGVLVIASALSPIVGAMMAGAELMPIGVFRSVLYAPIAVATVLALAAGAPEEGAGPEAAAAAAAGWVLVFAAGETMASGVFHFFLFPQFLVSPEETRLLLVETLSERFLAPSRIASWVGLCVATVPLLVAVGLCCRSGRRAAGAVPAVLVIALACAAIALSPMTGGEWTQLEQVPKLDRSTADEEAGALEGTLPPAPPESP